jgi:hypothetical protein
MAIRMRIRSPEAVETVQGEDDWTLGQLMALIREKMGVRDFALKTGFPPADIDLSAKNAKLQELKLNGATLTLVPIEELSQAPDGQAKAQSSSAMNHPTFKPKRVDIDETVVEWEEGGGYLGKGFLEKRA